MKKNDMMLWMSKGVTAEEAIKLSNAGFTPDMLDDSNKKEELEETVKKELEELEEAVKKELEEPEELDKKEQKEPEPDPKDSEIEKLKKEIADLQKLNRHQDFSGGEKAKSDLDIAKEIAAKLF